LDIRQGEIEEYLDENGKGPFREWLLSLKDIKARARIRMRVNRLRLGNFGDCRFLGNGVYELKIDFGPGYRIYLGRESDVTLILLCGGHKKNQRKDIVKAKKLWQDYVRRIK
jgi:putative addiction module killer protein